MVKGSERDLEGLPQVSPRKKAQHEAPGKAGCCGWGEVDNHPTFTLHFLNKPAPKACKLTSAINILKITDVLSSTQGPWENDINKRWSGMRGPSASYRGVRASVLAGHEASMQ